MLSIVAAVGPLGSLSSSAVGEMAKTVVARVQRRGGEGRSGAEDGEEESEKRREIWGWIYRYKGTRMCQVRDAGPSVSR